ncbi:ABC transporter permease [Methylomonas sp. SURF-2]|uniref:ABC transporter permease n=1 Tax=Methylomonas subterranea TaxID=2952225 RepID=A0ABT1TG85_9GAMM|nr:ABC transporter permease [Methylomonas sp. SURF-2]MCQ8104465.1 ABC transporter permease [Methylomonas sp. SURF-2]
MLTQDILLQAFKAIMTQPVRTGLIILAMSIGVASVNVLTALGDSARQYVINEFESLGTHLVIVLPGRSETTGGHPPIFGETPRDLTLDDANALLKSRHIAAMAPVVIGSAPISSGGLERETNIMGSNHALLKVRHLTIQHGQFLPDAPTDKEIPVCVIGLTIAEQLFPNRLAVGQWLRINDRRFRVIGVLAKEGQSIGVGFDEIVIIPVASALALFDSHSLFRILVETHSQQAMYKAVEEIKRIITVRHDGEEDVTIITQDSVVNTFNKILSALTLSVAGIAAVSLAVAGVLVMNVMLISVSQRTAEIGLLKALGATRRKLLQLFLAEAALLSLVGALVGSLLGIGGIMILQWWYPGFPLSLPLWSWLSAIGVALGTGLLFGVLPARQAAGLDPVSSLSRR